MSEPLATSNPTPNLHYIPADQRKGAFISDGMFQGTIAGYVEERPKRRGRRKAKRH